ncbi:MAG: NAD-dependent epimerase/dehydratase family protein [Planctomycetota bacterium]
MKLLITGGCGFVGTNLISHLNRTGGYDVTVFDNESLGERAFLEGLDTDFIHGDLRDADGLRDAVKGKDAVVHLAADTRVIPSIEKPRYNFEVNAWGSFNLLEAMRETGVDQLASASTGGAILGDVPPPVHEEMVAKPVSPYGASKLCVEGYANAYGACYGIKTVSLRFSNVYGPRSFHKGSVVAHFFKQILADEPLVVYGDGSQSRDFVFVEDLSEGIRRALKVDRTEVVQLGVGIPTSVNELIEIMREVIGKDIAVQYKDFRAGEIVNTHCDISKARKVLGYDPRTSLQDGLQQTWTWFTENEQRFL